MEISENHIISFMGSDGSEALSFRDADSSSMEMDGGERIWGMKKITVFVFLVQFNSIQTN